MSDSESHNSDNSEASSTNDRVQNPQEESNKGSKKGRGKKKNKKRSKDHDTGSAELQRGGSEPQIGGSKATLRANSRAGLSPQTEGPGGNDLETLIAQNFSHITDPPHNTNNENAVAVKFADDQSVTTKADDDLIKHWKRHLPRSYGYFSLFRFSTPFDRIYILVGVIAAIVGGLVLPAMIFIFGNMVRTMVLIGRIEHSVDCSKYKNEALLGSQANCRNYALRCLREKPFNGKNLSHEFLQKTTLSTMREFVAWNCILTVIFTISASIYFICWNIAADNQVFKIRRHYFESLLRKDLSWFDTQADPDAVNKIMDHTRRILEGIGENIPIAINIVVIAILCFLLALAHGWELTFVAVVAVLVLLFTTWLKIYCESWKIWTEHKTHSFGREIVQEVVTNIKTVIFYAGQKRELLRYKKELQRNFGKVFFWMAAHSISVFTMWVLNFLVWSIIFWYGIALVIVSVDCKQSSSYIHYDAGDVIIIILSMIFGVGNLYLVYPVYHSIIVAKNYGKKVFRVIDGPIGIDNLGTEGIILDKLEGSIELQEVRFTYPSRRDEVAINHLSMKIKAGSKVAFVGITGSGKSTLLKLICKEYVPDSGFIRIDGYNIRDLNTKWLRSQIGVVPQQSVIFNDTIEANVRMGKVDATFYEIQEVCKMANAHNFIVSMKEAYQTRIDDDGFKLTAGQKQRIAIARALLLDPKILLLDEPTSSLDLESEQQVLETLERVSKSRTVVTTAHRLHTITNTDNIFVMKRGKIAEKGTHANLINSKGPYSQLASGSVDRPSTSIRPQKQVLSFDTTETRVVYDLKLFSLKPMLPNIYVDLLTLNPSAALVSKWLMKENEKRTQEGLLSSHNKEDDFYTLEMKDSTVKTGDTELSKSEASFKDVPQATTQHYNPVEDSADDSEVEGFKEMFDPKHNHYWQVFSMVTSATNKLLLLITIVASCFLGLVMPIYAVLFSEVINLFSDSSAIPGDWKVAKMLGYDNMYTWIIVGFVLLGVSAGVAAALQDFALSFGSYNMVLYLRKKLFASLLKKNLSFFENPTNSVGALLALLSTNVTTLRYVLSGFYAILMESFVTIIFSIILAAAIFAGDLTGYTIPIAALVILINCTDSYLAKKQQVTGMNVLMEISELILQVFKGKESVTTLQLEAFFMEKFNTVQKQALRRRRKLSYIRTLTFGLSQTALFWGYSLFLYLGANEIVYFGRSFVDVIAVGQLLLYGMIIVGTNFSIMMWLKEAIKSGSPILSIIRSTPDIKNFTGDPVDTCKGAIYLNNVKFWYTGSTDNLLLKGVTLYIPQHITVAVVGSSESGKSIFLDLITRLYDVSHGEISLDGKNVKELNVLSMRRHMGFVEKKPELFFATVAENIAYGNNMEELSMRDIIEAAQMTNMHNFICSLPEGYETKIGGPTDHLSSSQKLRIIIARALLKNPEILLIDELTSNLDEDGDKLLRECIDIARKKRTCIMIAHRLDTIKKADLIVVMIEGYIGEMGTHEELLKIPNGIYAKLWRSQNPLEDDGFSKGKSWTGKPIERPPKPKPPPPTPPKSLKTSVKPVPPPEPPKVEEKKSSGGCGICSTLGT